MAKSKVTKLKDLKQKEKRFISSEELKTIQSNQQGLINIDMAVAARTREIAALNMQYLTLIQMRMQHSKELKAKYNIKDNESIDINTGEIVLGGGG